MPTNSVIHKISENYWVIEHQFIDKDENSEVFYKVSDTDNNEFGGKFYKLSEAISYINNLTFK